MNATRRNDRQRVPRFIGYLMTSAMLMMVIVGRLYAQHEIRQLKFDLANLILITTLVALPFAAANTFWNCFATIVADEFKNDRTWITIRITLGLTLLMAPVFFVTEALLSWSHWIFKQTKK